MSDLQVASCVEDVLWLSVLDDLQKKTDSRSFNMWLKNIEPVSRQNGSIIIGVPNKLILQWIMRDFQLVMEDIIKIRIPGIKEINFVVTKNNNIGEKKESEYTVQSKQKNLNSIQNASMSLESFVVGECNRMAFNAAKDVVTKIRTNYNPLFIYGGYGQGKTHLLRGIYNALIRDKRQSQKDIEVVYLTSEDFTSRFIKALQEKKLDHFRKFYRKVDVILLDDVHLLVGKKATQDELLHTFDALNDLDKQIVISSDSHPKMIKLFKEGLQTRFLAGMLIKIDPPDYKTRLNVLRVKAGLMNLKIPERLLAEIAYRVTTCIRELEGVLTCIAAYSKLEGKDISEAIINKVLHEASLSKPVNIEEVANAVSKQFNVNPSDIRSTKKTAKFSHPRHISIYLSRIMTDMSLTEIGRYFGDRSHSAVLYSISKVEKNISEK